MMMMMMMNMMMIMMILMMTMMMMVMKMTMVMMIMVMMMIMMMMMMMKLPYITGCRPPDLRASSSTTSCSDAEGQWCTAHCELLHALAACTAPGTVLV